MGKLFKSKESARLNEASDILIVLNGYSLQRDQLGLWNSWQIRRLLPVLHSLDCKIIFILTPFSSKPKGKCAFKLLRIEGFLPLQMLFSKVFSLATMGIEKDLKDRKDFFSLFSQLTWDAFLKNKSIRSIFAVNPDSGLIKVCSLAGIKLFDLQHGALSETGRLETKCKSNGEIYNPLHLVWSSWEKLFYESCGVESLILGYPKYELSSPKKYIDVLITLSYDMPEGVDSEAMFGKFLLSAMKLLISSELLVGIRPHPMSCRRVTVGEYIKSSNYFHRYLKSALKSKNFIFLDPFLTELAFDISRSKILMTEPGSTIIEAAAQGIPTVVISSSLKPILQQSSLIKHGYVHLMNHDLILEKLPLLKETTMRPFEFESSTEEIKSLIQSITR
jgi:hypothetical protein